MRSDGNAVWEGATAEGQLGASALGEGLPPLSRRESKQHGCWEMPDDTKSAEQGWHPRSRSIRSQVGDGVGCRLRERIALCLPSPHSLP